MVSAFADGEDMRKMLRLAKIRLFMDIPGNGIMMAIPVKSVGVTKTLSFLTNGKQPEGGIPEMKFENELIVVILNEG